MATKGQKAEFILKISRHQNAKNSAEPTVLLKRVFLQLQFSQIGQVLMQTMMKKSLEHMRKTPWKRPPCNACSSCHKIMAGQGSEKICFKLFCIFNKKLHTAYWQSFACLTFCLISVHKLCSKCVGLLSESSVRKVDISFIFSFNATFQQASHATFPSWSRAYLSHALCAIFGHSTVCKKFDLLRKIITSLVPKQ